MKKSKKLLIGTNTKMFKTLSETVAYLSRLSGLTADISREDLTLFVIPSSVSLESARNSIPGNAILLGAQNMMWEERGQFTGEISPLMLSEIGIDIVEIGHSERRHIFKESDQDENKKVISAINHGFIALLCIGETAEEKKYHISDEVLKTQLKIGLYQVTKSMADKIWIAYEPVWAIGVNGSPASKEYVAEKHAVIRNTLAELFGKEESKSIPILYGGSVNNQNAAELISQANVDGLFIGRSAWDADNFNQIIRETLPLWKDKA